MLSAKDVANYFLSLMDEEIGDSITNLKLQKLVYYAQGFHLAIYDKPLFEDSIEAWQHGPVVPNLYLEYKEHGSESIPKPTGLDFSIYTEEIKELLDEVYEVMGQFSAWKLRNMTHEEPPWRDTPINSQIPNEILKSYFKSQLQES